MSPVQVRLGSNAAQTKVLQNTNNDGNTNTVGGSPVAGPTHQQSTSSQDLNSNEVRRQNEEIELE